MPSPNEYDNFDATTVAKEIGSELFAPVDAGSSASGLESDVLDSSTTPATPAVGENANNPRVVPGQNSPATAAQSQLKALPKSWKKDMEPLWQKADPALHDYVYNREADVMRGLQQYQTGHNSWNELVKPFAPILEANPEVNPIQLMQGLMNTHLQLLNPNADPAQKAQLALSLLKEYGIDLGNGGNVTHQSGGDPALQREIQALRTELSQVKQFQTQSQKRDYDSGVQNHLKSIETFAADPKNKYFDEVGNDIFRLIQTGAATDLATAYEMAIWSNPGTRAKILAEQQASPLSPDKPRKPNGQFVNLDSDAVPARKQKPGTMDSTIDAVIASHYSKH